MRDEFKLVQHLNTFGGFIEFYQSILISESVNNKIRSQTYCDKVVGREGNNPDY